MTTTVFGVGGSGGNEAPGWHNFIVPFDVDTITITVDGAGSGGSRGGRVTGTFFANPSSLISVLVGEGGRPPVGDNGGGFADGGGGHGGKGGLGQAGGWGGAGASAIRLGTQDSGRLVLVAGGAGGTSGDNGRGGHGGAGIGEDAHKGTGGSRVGLVETAKGGSQNSPGNAGKNSFNAGVNGTIGNDFPLVTAGRGGQMVQVSSYGGGGGGGGYRGGGGGAASFGFVLGGAPGTGGGGGSNYVDGLLHSATSDRGAGNTGTATLTLTYTTSPALNVPPSVPSEILIDGSPEIAEFPTRSMGSVTISAEVGDPNTNDVVRLYGEISVTKDFPSRTNFYSRYVSAGERVEVTLNGLAPNTHYYVRLYSQDSFGAMSQPQAGSVSGGFNSIDFWTNRPPNPPTLGFPSENSVLESDDPVLFTWNSTDPDEGDSQGGFRLRYRKAATTVAPASDWIVIDYGTTAAESATFAPTGAIPGEVWDKNVFYDWSIQTKDAGGLWGEWALPLSWFSLGPTFPPVPLYPTADAAIDVNVPNQFQWRFVDGTPGDYQVKADIRYRVVGGEEADWITVFGQEGAVNIAPDGTPIDANGNATSGIPGRVPFWDLGGPFQWKVDRTNLVKNPSFETGIAGWENKVNMTVAQTTGGAVPGNYVLQGTVIAPAAFSEVRQSASGTGAIPIQGGHKYLLMAKFWINTTGNVNRNVAMGLDYWKADGTPLTSSFGVGGVVPGIWHPFNFSTTAPSDAAYARAVFSFHNALAGETLKIDHVLLEQTDEVFPSYFDGDTTGESGVSYNWTGVAGDSESTRLTAVSGSGLTRVFEAGYHYEWQVRTTDDGLDTSEWSQSAPFYTVGVIKPPEGGPLTGVPQGSLGCGEHRVFVYQRGGNVLIGEITPLANLTYSRQRDDISSALMITNGFDADCGRILSDLHCWMHEIVIFRNGKRVWEGPITRIAWQEDNVEIEAKDVMAYVYRRIMRQGYNDSYRCIGGTSPGCVGGVVLGLTTVVERAKRIIMNAMAPYDANILPFLTPMPMAGDAQQSRVVPDYTMTAWEAVDDLAATAGLDYVAVGRRIILWDVHRPIGRLPELRDKDFDQPPVVTEYGMQLANYFAVSTNNGVWGAVERPEGFDPYGPIEHLASAYGENEGTEEDVLTPEGYAQMVRVLTSQAQRGINDRWPTPLVVRVPESSALSADAPVTMDQLVPGVWIPVFATGLKQVAQWQKLDSVKVEVNDNGEKVLVSMSPAPSGGRDPDADDTATEDES